MIPKRGQHRENVGSYSSQSGRDVIAGIPLGEEPNGHLSQGTSDIITMQLRD